MALHPGNHILALIFGNINQHDMMMMMSEDRKDMALMIIDHVSWFTFIIGHSNVHVVIKVYRTKVV